MDDLVTFLRVRLAEDEAAARAWLPFGNPDAAARDHVARHDPARVLREVDAKRRIIEAAEDASGIDAQLDGQLRVGRRDEAIEPYVGDVILRALALPYADRPDYRDEWRP
jgi:hypothetical protein